MGSFLKSRLEELTSHKLDSVELLEFVDSLCLHSSQDTKKRMLTFSNKWKQDGYMSRFSLTYISGSWCPQSASTKELRLIRGYETFMATQYRIIILDADGTHPWSSQNQNVNKSSQSFPFHIKELVQHPFWKEFYNAFGQKTLKFLFEKCLILYKVEDRFYIVFGTENCTLNQIIAKATFTTLQKKNGVGVGSVIGNPYRLRDQSVTNKKGKELNGIMGTRKRPRSNEDDSTSVNLFKKARINLKDNPILEGEKIPSTSSTSNVMTSSSTICLKKTANLEMKSVNLKLQRTDSSTKPKKDDFFESNSSNLTLTPPGLIRWFIPSPKWLKVVIEEREKLKSESNIPSTLTNNSSAVLKDELNFIGIFTTNEFVKNIFENELTIVKQSCGIRFPFVKFPKGWEGLKIPKDKLNIHKDAGKNFKISINVYKISEAFARSFKIHVNKKVKRSGRRKKHAEEKSKMAFEDKNVPGFSSNVNPATATTISKSIESNSFNPLLPLETISIFYNKSSWAKLPQEHVLRLICTFPSLHDACKLLTETIFKTNVGVRVNLALPHISELKEILEKFVTFHRRVQDLHQLVKSRLAFWLLKKEEKMLNKEFKRQERKAWREENPIIPKRRNKDLKSQNDVSIQNVEMIDLTMDSQGTTPEMVFSDPEIWKNSSIFETIKLSSDSINAESNIASTTFVDKSFTSNPQNQTRISNTSIILSSKFQRKAFVYAKLKEKIPPTCLTMTLKQIMHLSGADRLLGLGKNIQGFFNFVRKSVILAGTKSSLHLGELMALLDPNKCTWLDEIKDPETKITLLAQIAKWLFTEYVMIILRQSFYITEGNDSRMHAVFFLRENWKSVSDVLKNRFFKSGTLQRVECLPMTSSVANSKRSLEGINARIRFIPKKNLGLRPILNVKRETEFSKLKVWRSMLNHIVKKHSPHRVRDPNVMRQKWVKFLQEWREQEKPKLYFIRLDIQDAYPSVRMDKLQRILESRTDPLGTMIHKDFKVISNSRILFRQSSFPEQDREGWNSSILTRPCIVQATPKMDVKINASKITSEITSCFQKNIVRIGKQKFSFDYGLPQGWILSESLCNIYYGSMDEKYLQSYLNESQKGEFLLTSVDDYIFITADPLRAAEFYKKMNAGLAAFGSELNHTKLNSNLYPRRDKPVAEDECERVDFCGWKFCLTCGHIMRDFSGYVGQDIASTISFSTRINSSPEMFLHSRMKVMLAARLQAFLLDPAINCRDRILLNIYDAGLLFSFRLYAICRVVYPNLNAVKDPQRAYQIVKAVMGCVRTMSKMILNVFRHIYPPQPTRIECSRNPNNRCPCIPHKNCKETSQNSSDNVGNINFSQSALSEPEIYFVAYAAFILKLQKHSEPFKDQVLPRLEKLKEIQGSFLSSEQVKWIINVIGNSDGKMPNHFELIRI